MASYYLWFKAFHIVAFVSWMAVLFYLPRLYVYHAENRDKKDFVDVVKIQEYKLYYFIGLPSLILTVVSGLLMVIAHPEVMKTGAWIHIKMSVALLLIVYHFSLGYFRKTLANDTCTKSGNFFRAYNEIPTIFLILIAVLAVLKSVNLIFVGAVVLFGIFVIYRVFKQKAH